MKKLENRGRYKLLLICRLHDMKDMLMHGTHDVKKVV